MSRKNQSKINENPTPLRRSPRFLQTPPRRSPRFLPQTSDPNLSKNQPIPRNNPKNPISKHTRRKSSPDSAITTSLEETIGQSSRTCRKRASGFIQEVQRRRSPRLASYSNSSAEKEGNLVSEKVIDRDSLEKTIKVRKTRKICVKFSTPGTGEERKRKEVCEKREETGIGGREVKECGGLEGWTKGQEAALQRAYLVARPSPHFWKKVSKMVPGKSAQECSDRIHSELATPCQIQRLSKARKIDVSPVVGFTLSDSSSKDHTKENTKKQRRAKQNILAAQKTVRHLLRKHQLIDQSKEADLFSVFETSSATLNIDFPDVRPPITPECPTTSLGFLKSCSQGFSTAYRKRHSRFKPPDQVTYASPEVLKPIKNMVLHEKYINQLHCREAKRTILAKTSSTVGKASKNITAWETNLKIARNALMSEAKETIAHFQHIQANIMGDEGFGIDADADVDDLNDDDYENDE